MSTRSDSTSYDYATVQSKFDSLGLTAYMKDVIALLLENRPENPVEFVSEYFHNAARGAPPLTRSYGLIRLTEHSRMSFMDNLVSAYNTLNSSTGGPGLTGRQYNKLLRSICADFPIDIVHSIIQLLGKTSSDIVDFPAFYSGVYACILYEEFFEYAEWLFKGCDTKSTGSISRESFLLVMQNMANSDHKTPPARVFADAIRTIGVDNPLKTTVSFKEFILAVFNATSHEAMAALSSKERKRTQKSSTAKTNSSTPKSGGKNLKSKAKVSSSSTGVKRNQSGSRNGIRGSTASTNLTGSNSSMTSSINTTPVATIRNSITSSYTSNSNGPVRSGTLPVLSKTSH